MTSNRNYQHQYLSNANHSYDKILFAGTYWGSKYAFLCDVLPSAALQCFISTQNNWNTNHYKCLHQQPLQDFTNLWLLLLAFIGYILGIMNDIKRKFLIVCLLLFVVFVVGCGTQQPREFTTEELEAFEAEFNALNDEIFELPQDVDIECPHGLWKHPIEVEGWRGVSSLGYNRYLAVVNTEYRLLICHYIDNEGDMGTYVRGFPPGTSCTLPNETISSTGIIASDSEFTFICRTPGVQP